MKKRTKILIIVVVVVAVLAVTGFFVGRHYVVNYAFDKFFESGMAGLIDSAPIDSGQNGENAEQSGNKDAANSNVENTDGRVSLSEKMPDTKKDSPSSQKAPEEMTEREVINEVMKDSSLTSKMGGMISSSDRAKIISIVLSNFTPQEISQYSAKAAKGLDSKTKSELISIARSRLTSSQLAECMQIAYKYADEIRPYLKKN